MKLTTFSIHGYSPFLSREYQWERFLRRWGIGGLLLLVIAYTYFVSVSVFLVIERKEATLKTEHISAATASLERDLFSKIEALTEKSGSSLGLTSIPHTTYVEDISSVVEAGLSKIQGL